MCTINDTLVTTTSITAVEPVDEDTELEVQRSHREPVDGLFHVRPALGERPQDPDRHHERGE